MMPGNIGENPDFNKLILSWEPMTKVMEDWCKQMGEMWVKNLSDDFEKELHKKIWVFQKILIRGFLIPSIK